MKIAACDDEPHDLDLLCALIRQYNSGLDLTTFQRASALLDAFQSDFYDLVFLDIEMESPNGFEVAELLMSRFEKPLIVFVTNSSAYTLRGYGVAFRYLTKPIFYDSIKNVMDLALEQIIPQKITLPQKDCTLLLAISEIYCVEIRNHTTILCTKSGQYEIRRSLKDIEAQLPAMRFAKPHNSYIVNLSEVRSMTAKSLTLTNGDQIPVSQRNRKPFEQALFQYVRR